MADARRWLTVSLGVGVVLGMMDACIILDPDHCKTDGDCSPGMVCDPCVAASPGVDGCVAEADRLDTDLTDDKCQAAEGSATTDDDTTVGMETMTTTTEPMATDTIIDVDTTATDDGTESTTTGEPVPCEVDEDCLNPAQPFCQLMLCVDCSQTSSPDAECAARDPLLPVCAGEECVQCTPRNQSQCTGTTPVCNPETNACVRCTEHAECGEAACNFFTGACLPAASVVRVGSGQAFTTIQDAVDSLGMEGTVIVHDGSYNETIDVDGGRVVAFLANAGVVPQWVRTSGSTAPQLTVLDATVLVDGIQFSNNGLSGQPAFRVSVGRAWVDRARIVTNLGGGISVEAEGELVVRNSFLANGNGRIELNVTGADSMATVLDSTIGANFGTSRGLACDPMAMVSVRNSIIVSRSPDPEVSCMPVNATYTATEMVLPGTGNVGVDDQMDAWFEDYDVGDLHLTAAGEALLGTVAQWQAGDPLVDIDLDPRVGVDGMSEPAGADVVP